MSFIDVRTHISFRYINTVLLDVAQFPAKYPEFVYLFAPVAKGTHPSQNPACSGIYVEMSRQACATIVLNCASELWSVLVECFLALEPSCQQTKDVRNFFKYERLDNLEYFGIYFSTCNKNFKGTKPYNDLKLIYDIRNDLVHDKPDGLEAKVETKIDKWIKRIESHVNRSQLRWLPDIPTLWASGHPVPSSSSCIAVMNIMRYPVASWILEATQSIISELQGMMVAHQGPKRHNSEAWVKGVQFSDELPLDKFLQIGGKSVQIVSNSKDGK